MVKSLFFGLAAGNFEEIKTAFSGKVRMGAASEGAGGLVMCCQHGGVVDSSRQIRERSPAARVATHSLPQVLPGGGTLHGRIVDLTLGMMHGPTESKEQVLQWYCSCVLSALECLRWRPT